MSIRYTVYPVKCTKYETCAILHRFHILYNSYDCSSKIEPSHAFSFWVVCFQASCLLILESIGNDQFGSLHKYSTKKTTTKNRIWPNTNSKEKETQQVNPSIFRKIASDKTISFTLVQGHVRYCYSRANHKGCFTYTPNPNRNRTETVTATELHRFVFGRPFTYEPNPWTKSKKMSV